MPIWAAGSGMWQAAHSLACIAQGFHGSQVETSSTVTDIAFSNFMSAIGVDADFISRGMKPSIHGIYEPTPEDVLKAGLATTEWL